MEINSCAPGKVSMSNDQSECEVDLSAYSVGDYAPGPAWKRAVWLAVSRFFFETWFPWPSAMKSGILRCFGAEVGEGVVWKPRMKIKYPWFLRVGDHCWIGEEVWIDNLVRVDLASHVVLSQGAYLLTGNHDYKSPRFDLLTGPISLGAGAWIGAKAVVCPGVTVEKMAVLAVGSVATRNLEAHGIYSGNPAVKVRERVMRGDNTQEGSA